MRERYSSDLTGSQWQRIKHLFDYQRKRSHDLRRELLERIRGQFALTEQMERIRRLTLYHWWPGGADHTATD